MHSALKLGEPWGQHGAARWPARATEGSILLWGSLWVPGCSQHLCPSVTAGAERLRSQGRKYFIPRCPEAGFSQRTEAVTRAGRVYSKYLNGMNENVNQ